MIHFSNRNTTCTLGGRGVRKTTGAYKSAIQLATLIREMNAID